jgi:D-ribose pyranose/furanose isomerase RbsD
MTNYLVDLRQLLLQINEKKRNAIKSENFVLAKEIKSRQQYIENAIAQLTQLHADKRSAIDNENFDRVIEINNEMTAIYRSAMIDDNDATNLAKDDAVIVDPVSNVSFISNSF